MKQLKQGATFWFTGLPCSGKTTVAESVASKLSNKGYKNERLDGDRVRKKLTPDLGFSREDRRKNVQRNAFVANLLAKNGVIVLASFITPYNSSQQLVRAEAHNTHLIHVNCPVSVCKQRDVKGMYEKAEKGEIENFTGISDPYEPPENADLTLYTDMQTVEQSTYLVLEYMEKQELLDTAD